MRWEWQRNSGQAVHPWTGFPGGSRVRTDIHVSRANGAVYRRRRTFVRGGYPRRKAYVKPQLWLAKPPALARERTVHSNPGNIVCLFECTNTIKGDAQTAGTLGAASSPLCMRSSRIHVEPSFVSSFVSFLAIVRLTDGATIFPRQSRTPANPAR